MDLTDIFKPPEPVQGVRCSGCGTSLDLAYADIHEDVAGIDITAIGLPVLRCPACGRDHLPERSRQALVRTHIQATEKGERSVRCTRKKMQKDYGFTKVPFLYDSDDYRYIPGLERAHDEGFLTPVFFNRSVLLKYDTAPGYSVRFASTTYGEIIPPDEASISFGINRHGKVVMWLGDIATLPEQEQYYLRSENVESDHSIGSEFYDGQIDVIFTDPTAENRLFGLRSDFLEAWLKRFGNKVAHLDDTVFDLALAFNAPIVDTTKERRHVADTLNKIHIESLDVAALGNLLKGAGIDPGKLGGLKRLQLLLGTITQASDAAAILSPLFVLYDLRVVYLHLSSEQGSTETLKTITDRLGIPEGSGFLDIYKALIAAMTASYEKLIAIL